MRLLKTLSASSEARSVGDQRMRSVWTKSVLAPGIMSLALLSVVLGSGMSNLSAATSTTSYSEQIRSYLHGKTIATAPAADLIKAVKKVIADNPKDAAAILTEVFSVNRPDMRQIAGQLVGASIEGLGPNPTNAQIGELVRVGVEEQPEAVLSIVSTATSDSPCGAVPAIVQSAAYSLRKSQGGVVSDGKNVIASDKNVVPTDKDVVPLDKNRLHEIVQSAMEAKPDCGYNSVALETLAEDAYLAAANGLPFPSQDAPNGTLLSNPLSPPPGGPNFPPDPPVVGLNPATG